MLLLSRNEMNNLKLNKVVWGCYHLGRPRVEMQWVLVERYSSSLHSPWTFLRVFPGISADFPKGQPLHGCMTHAKHELHGEIPSQNISNYHLTDLPMAWVYKCEKKETNSAASWNFISTNPGQLNPKFYKGTFEPASKSTSKGRAHRSACKRETSWLRFSIWTSHQVAEGLWKVLCFPIFRLIHAPI